MVNLLPQKEKISIQKEYSIRLIIVFLVLLIITMLLSIIFLIPSFVSLNLKENMAVEQIKLIEKTIPNKNGIDVEKELNMVLVKTEVLKKTDNEIALKDIIYKIIKNKPEGIRISDFLYNKIQRKEIIEKVISIQGISNTRDDLLKFKTVLSGIEYFKEIDLPLSNLTKDTDVYFLINITLESYSKMN